MTQRQSANRYIVIGIIIIALVLIVGLYLATRSSGGSGNGGGSPAASTQNQTTPVVFARQSIPAGTTFSTTASLNTYFEVKDEPASLAPLASYRSTQAIGSVIKSAGCQPSYQPGCQGQITATQTIYQGLPVVSGMFSTLGQYRTTAGPAFRIPYGYVAISLDVSAANSVAGSIQPGDTIDLIGSYTGNAKLLGIGAPPQTQYILSDVKVIGIGAFAAPGASASSSTAAPAAGSIVILARFQEALVIQHLKDFGWQLSAVLRSARETTIPHFRTVPVTDRWFFVKASNPFRSNPGY